MLGRILGYFSHDARCSIFWGSAPASRVRSFANGACQIKMDVKPRLLLCGLIRGRVASHHHRQDLGVAPIQFAILGIAILNAILTRKGRPHGQLTAERQASGCKGFRSVFNPMKRQGIERQGKAPVGDWENYRLWRLLRWRRQPCAELWQRCSDQRIV